MKIAYIAHTRYPTEKAHGHQITKVCDALVALGHQVTLVAPDVHNEVQDTFSDYYGVDESFAVLHLPTKDALTSSLIPGKYAMFFTMRSYRKALRSYLSVNKVDLLYARSPHVIAPMIKTGMPVVLELHTLPRRGKKSFVSHCKQCARIVCLTSAMKSELVSWGVPEQLVIVEGDAVDLERFENVKDESFNLPEGKKIVGYIGSLSTMDHLEKGVDQLVRCTAKLHESSNTFVFIVGGPEEVVNAYKRDVQNMGLTTDQIRLEGRIPSTSVPAAITACDVCVYTAPKSSHPFFVRDTSPLKLFEYLASGVPVVCADIPPVRDIVDDTSVWFYEPGNERSLCDAIENALRHKDEAKAKSAKGKEIAKYHTWKKRMERILTAVSE